MRLLMMTLFCQVFFPFQLHAQTVVQGKIIDAVTQQPVDGASIRCSDADCHCGCISNEHGLFEVNCTDCRRLVASSVGYADYVFEVNSQSATTIVLTRNTLLMDQVMVTASKGEAAKRSETPVAISKIDAGAIRDAKASSVDQLLNKIAGVNMVNLGNEQHQMSIRQPMTTKGLFLYLEDGIPIRTTGLFNHNALLEMNMAATQTIEVIKGPASALYGSEAIGGAVNFISRNAPATPLLQLSAQTNNIGYKRTDLSAGFTKGKLGIAFGGYYANKAGGRIEYNDFNKGIFTAKADYRFSDKTKISNVITYMHYYSDMPGGVDSSMFAQRSFKNPQTFTFRKVNAFRFRSTLTHSWNSQSKSNVSLLFRDNKIGQNPAYRIKDDYKKIDGVFTGDPRLAHGEINESSFNSYLLIVQHRQQFDWKNLVLTGGVNLDISPSAYFANYIAIEKDTLHQKYQSYRSTDSTLSRYSTVLSNYAAFFNIEFSPVNRVRVVASLRDDLFRYRFDNHLAASAFTGSRDTLNTFNRLTPKIGFTYNPSKRFGVYANYSEGFVPPQVAELFTGVKVPNLRPALFINEEVGGWFQMFDRRVQADWSLYRLNGKNEIVSVKQDDGSYMNQNAGRTLHEGIEVGINAVPAKDMSLRITGAYNRHQFVEYIEKGTSYNGKAMNNAPKFVGNAELWYKPSFIKGWRVGAELQRVGRYFVDPQNTATYDGYYQLNLRTGYDNKKIGLWLNVINVTNNYYSTITTKSSFGYSYQLADPVNFNLGISYRFFGE